jgi:mono/diheme cytochrome c family protein
MRRDGHGNHVVMLRVDRSVPLSFCLAAVCSCAKPADSSPPTTDPSFAEPGPTEYAQPAEPAEADPEAEERAAAEREAAAAAEKKAQADAQIEQGKELYGANCASCHGANGEGKKGKYPPVVGEGALPLDPPKKAKLRKGIQFNTAKDVADFVVANMPPKKGGSLEPEEYYAILAFDLSANGIAIEEPVTGDNAASITLPRPEPEEAAEPPPK